MIWNFMSANFITILIIFRNSFYSLAYGKVYAATCNRYAAKLAVKVVHIPHAIADDIRNHRTMLPGTTIINLSQEGEVRQFLINSSFYIIASNNIDSVSRFFCLIAPLVAINLLIFAFVYFPRLIEFKYCVTFPFDFQKYADVNSPWVIPIYFYFRRLNYLIFATCEYFLIAMQK